MTPPTYRILSLLLIICSTERFLVADGFRVKNKVSKQQREDPVDEPREDLPAPDQDPDHGVDPQQATIEDPSVDARTAPTSDGARAAQTSLDWMETLKQEEKNRLMDSVGTEVYDEECTDHIVSTLMGPSHSDGANEDTTWWLDAIDSDPLVKGYQDREKNAEIDRKFEVMVSEADKADLGFLGNIKTWFWKRWTNLKNAWRKTKNWFVQSKIFGHGGEIEKFRDEVKKIKARQTDADGKMATVCSLDGATLKLLPFSREFHYQLQQRDAGKKCSIHGMPNADNKLKLGWMDPDRVIRATQMAIYQECYHKCVNYVVENFEKTGERDGTQLKFCSKSYEEQKKSMQGEPLRVFLQNLLGNKESDVYLQCQKLLIQGDVGPEMFDFAIEKACAGSRPYTRPTTMYSPSESVPISLYKEAEQPVCAASAHNNYAGTVAARSCPEGTHCFCQAHAQDNHISTGERKSSAMSLFSSGKDHCSARRPTGAGALMWIDPTAVRESKWQAEVTKAVEQRAGKGAMYLGLGFLLAGATWGTVMGIGHTTILAAITSAWTSIVTFFGGFTLSGGGAATALVGAFTSPMAVMIGPSVALGLIGLTFIHSHASFDCSATIGCYPLKCEFTRDLNNGNGMCHMRAPDTGATSMLMWWMPPAGMKCAYQGSSHFAPATCGLEACTNQELAKSDLGYSQSPKSVKNKLDLKNCQPLNIKDMSTQQQNKFLLALRKKKAADESMFAAQDPATKESKEFTTISEMTFHLTNFPLPECLTDENCRMGQSGFQVDLNLQGKTETVLPFCHPVQRQCYRPLVSLMQVQVKDTDMGAWVPKLKKAMSWVLFREGASRGEDLIFILQEDGTEFPESTALIQLNEGDLAAHKEAAGTVLDKTVQIVVKTTQADGLSPVQAKERLQGAWSDATEFTAQGMGLNFALGSEFSVKIKSGGAMCEARKRPPHAAAGTCDVSSVKPGDTCALKCEQGWQAHNTVWCDNGVWSDEKPAEEFTSVPTSINLAANELPAFECRDVTCSAKAFPATCPRSVAGCFEWSDSKCDKGGLSGSDSDCVVQPAKGYNLKDEFSIRWECRADGQWHIPEGAQEPAMLEQKCTMVEHSLAVTLGYIEEDAGVLTVCDHAFSGKLSADGPAGECPVTCKPGYEPVLEDPLHCQVNPEQVSGNWKGVAKCRAITCDTSLLMTTRDASVAGFDCRGSTVHASASSSPSKTGDSLCGVICKDELTEATNTIECGLDGQWRGTATCSRKTGGMTGSGAEGETGSKSFGMRAALSAPILSVLLRMFI